MKLWEKHYKLDQQVEDFTTADDPQLDLQLVEYDCRASLAHAEMLQRMGVLTAAELKRLAAALRSIIRENAHGRFRIRHAEEDCHTAIENSLTRTCGDAGKKIHTYRSRNDQVLTALRLLYRDRLMEVRKRMADLRKAVERFRKKHGKTPMPGFTHTRKAMPSSAGLWAGFLREAMEDNDRVLGAVLDLIDQSPLGTGAGYGVPAALDRAFTQKRLGFRRLQKNPIYAQNSRGKFEGAILGLLTMILHDVNRASSDLILFSAPEFGFFVLPDRMLTGSSMMPHKKNPDPLEVLRSAYHALLGMELQVKSTTANLISGYHRDLQWTKRPVLEGFALTIRSLQMIVRVFDVLGVNQRRCEEAMTGELFVTERAYELVGAGLPFRDAYRQAAAEHFKAHSGRRR